MNKARQSPSSNDGLGKTKHISDMLKLDAHIIADSHDPVKLIASQIQYQMIVEKMYRQNARVK